MEESAKAIEQNNDNGWTENEAPRSPRQGFRGRNPRRGPAKKTTNGRYKKLRAPGSDANTPKSTRRTMYYTSIPRSGIAFHLGLNLSSRENHGPEKFPKFRGDAWKVAFRDYCQTKISGHEKKWDAAISGQPSANRAGNDIVPRRLHPATATALPPTLS